MPEPIRIGIVGVRNIGKNHLRQCVALEEVAAAAIVDTDPDRLRDVGEEFGVEARFTDMEAMLAGVELDAVVLAVPNHLHAPLTVRALEAGKHVLVEKPLSRTVQEADEMMRARDAGGKVLMVGMNQRFNPVTAGLKRQIAEGVIGEVYYGRTRWDLFRPFEGLWGRGDWFLSREDSGGGPVIDLGVHRLDLALHLMGFPRALSVDGVCFRRIGGQVAGQRGKKYGIEDGGVGMIRFEDNKCLILEASYFINTEEGNPQDMRLHAERGCVVQTGGLKLYQATPSEISEIPILPDEESAGSCVEHFVRVLRGQEPLGPTAEQGRESLRIIEALYRSATTGKRVELGGCT